MLVEFDRADQRSALNTSSRTGKRLASRFLVPALSCLGLLWRWSCSCGRRRSTAEKRRPKQTATAHHCENGVLLLRNGDLETLRVQNENLSESQNSNFCRDLSPPRAGAGIENKENRAERGENFGFQVPNDAGEARKATWGEPPSCFSLLVGAI